MKKIYTAGQIKSILPQRAPMLMLDRAEQTDEGAFRATKCVTNNEMFFSGHFPGHPIMPGVLQIEAMKQLAELAFRDLEGIAPEKDVYVMQLAKAKFRRPVHPGDRLLITITIDSHDAQHLGCAAQVVSAGGACSEVKLDLGVRDRSEPAAMPDAFDEFDHLDGVTMDFEKTFSLMPHRFPFLLIDYVAKAEGSEIIAVKNVSINEPIFDGMPESYPVLPESLLCEIAAQSGCACVLSRPENEGKLGYFMSIDRAEALAPVFAGDRLVVFCDLPPSKSKFGKGSCEMRVNGVTVFKVSLMFAIVDK